MIRSFLRRLFQLGKPQRKMLTYDTEGNTLPEVVHRKPLWGLGWIPAAKEVICKVVNRETIHDVASLVAEELKVHILMAISRGVSRAAGSAPSQVAYSGVAERAFSRPTYGGREYSPATPINTPKDSGNLAFPGFPAPGR